MSQFDLTTTDGVKAYLHAHSYESCTSVDCLDGGFSGFVYRAHLTGEIPSVIVKHVEGYAARWPEFKLNQDRMDYEAKTLAYLSNLPHHHPTVRTPSLLSFDKANHVLIIQDAGPLPSLKSWLQPTSPNNQITSIGTNLGSYLAHIHNTTAATSSSSSSSPQPPALGPNPTGRTLSSSVYYAALPAAAAKHGYTQPFIAEAALAAEREILSVSEVFTLGDFWTGNVLVSSAPEDSRLEPVVTVLDFELAKPGTAAFDVGQMGAEMLCLARFRDGGKGSLLLGSFLEAYGREREGGVDAAAVAVRVGAHLVTMMPRAWGSVAGEVRVREVLKEGVELIRMGWERDEVALRDEVVGGLM